MLNIAPETQFTDADWDHAEDLEWLDFGDNPRELTEDEAEFVFVLNTARRIRKQLGDWPTYGQVCEVINKQREEQNRINDKKEAAFHAANKK